MLHQAQSVFDHLYLRLSKRLSRQLFDSMNNSETLGPHLTSSRILAVLFAIAIHGLGVLIFISGLYLVARWPDFWLVVWGVICLGLTWIGFPRLGHWPKKVATRASHPALYALVDEVAHALNSPSVDGIVLDTNLNASFARIGWRQKRLLTLGMPLFVALTDQEKIALVAHELAHGVNGDPARGWFVGLAINVLSNWHDILRPRRLAGRDALTGGVLATLSNLILLTISVIPWSGAYALSFLMWRDSQRAEYLADSLAAEVSGTRAITSVLSKAHHLAQITQGASLSFWGKSDVLEELQHRVANLPFFDEDQAQRLGPPEEVRLDAMHPPTIYRLRLLLNRQKSHSKLTLPPTRFETLEKELISDKLRIRSELQELAESQLYSG